MIDRNVKLGQILACGVHKGRGLEGSGILPFDGIKPQTIPHAIHDAVKLFRRFYLVQNM